MTRPIATAAFATSVIFLTGIAGAQPLDSAKRIQVLQQAASAVWFAGNPDHQHRRARPSSTDREEEARVRVGVDRVERRASEEVVSHRLLKHEMDNFAQIGAAAGRRADRGSTPRPKREVEHIDAAMSLQLDYVRGEDASVTALVPPGTRRHRSRRAR